MGRGRRVIEDEMSLALLFIDCGKETFQEGIDGNIIFNMMFNADEH